MSDRAVLCLSLLAVIVIIGVQFWRLDRSRQSQIQLADLIVNRHGKIDGPATMLWALFVFDLWVVVGCVLVGAVPERLDMLVAGINGALIAPLLMKVFKAQASSPPEQPP